MSDDEPFGSLTVSTVPTTYCGHRGSMIVLPEVTADQPRQRVEGAEATGVEQRLALPKCDFALTVP